jgi:hypothetical protein
MEVFFITFTLMCLKLMSQFLIRVQVSVSDSWRLFIMRSLDLYTKNERSLSVALSWKDWSAEKMVSFS